MPFKSSIVKEALATMIFRPSPPLLVNAFALNAELPMIPLYRLQQNWVMRPNVDAVHWPNDVLELRWVTLK